MAFRFATTHWLSPRFPDSYVRALRAQFHHYGHELTVLGNGTDFDYPLKADRFHGWWAKLEWFAPWNADLRPAIVFDLDTFVVNDPSPFLDVDPSRLWMIREFMGPRKLGESGIFVAPNDESMCERIWQSAQGHDPRGMDGELIRRFPHSYLPEVVSGIYSYKAHGLRNGYPDDAVAICFHGKPKPPDTDGWALEWWQNSIS